MTYETITYEVRDHVAWLVLNRPHVLNATNHQMSQELLEVCERISRDAEVRVVVLTGAGEKAFSTGRDLKEDRPTDGSTFFEKRRRIHAAGIRSPFTALDELHQPLIAAIRGYALAGGLELALVCDIRIASEDAQFGALGTRRGRIGGGGASQRLPRIVGLPKAMELALTGETISAREALRIGLVNRVVPNDQLLAAAEAMAAQIAQGAPLSVVAVKEAMNTPMEMPLEQGLKLERELALLLAETDDQREGTLAFREKRNPAWRGS